MQKFKLHSSAVLGAILLLAAVFSSCGELMPSDGRFYIKSVQPYDKGIYQYQMISVTGKNSWWLKDSANKYIVGDTVMVVSIHSR
jgi:hypothetical protein